MTEPMSEEFEPTFTARKTLQWAYEMGAETLGEAYEMLDQLEMSNDVPEVLGESDTIEDMRQELELGIELAGADAPVTHWV